MMVSHTFLFSITDVIERSLSPFPLSLSLSLALPFSLACTSESMSFGKESGLELKGLGISGGSNGISRARWV